MNGLAMCAIFVGLFFLGVWVQSLRQWKLNSTIDYDIISGFGLAVGGVILIAGLCMLFGWA